MRGTKKKKIALTLITLGAVLGFALGWGPLKQALSVSTGYAAKRLCSEVFLAGRPSDHVWSVDLKLLPTFLLSYTIDDHTQTAHVSAPLGLAKQSATWREGLGCALTRGTTIAKLKKAGFQKPTITPPSLPWPQGDQVLATPLPPGIDAAKLNRAVEFAFKEPDPNNPTKLTRAVVVVHDGKIVAERYAKGFSPNTPLLSWSMAKSVTNSLVGILVLQNKIDLDEPANLKLWRDATDGRAQITPRMLLQMKSGLDFDETYGPFGDVTDMLFVSHDAAKRAASSPLLATINTPKDAPWSYSSGDTNILAKLVRNAIGDDALYHRFPTTALFQKIGAHSATFETDPSGTFVGSSFVYMTARDWARYGLLHLQDGEWQGERVLPKGWVKFSCTLTPGTPLGEYGAQFWLNRGNPPESKNRPYPLSPTDLCTAAGFETQRVAMFPSRKTVIVRLGLTRKRQDFPTDAFFARILEALPK